MKIYLLLAALLAAISADAHKLTFDLSRPEALPLYNEASGYGREASVDNGYKPGDSYRFSVKLPDGNYRVTMTLGDDRHKSLTLVRAESRRLFLEPTAVGKGDSLTVSFTINKRSPVIDNKHRIKLKESERDYLNWDEKLTLEIAGDRPAVRHVTVEPVDSCTTLYLCGNSTVVDQEHEPWASWGQMITRWFGPEVAVANYAESGMTTSQFIEQKRLDKIVSLLKPGDYVLCEFGHNDQKEKFAGAGAWYNFAHNLKVFIDKARSCGANVILCTPTRRRVFSDSATVTDTHLDYPQAIAAIAARENIPLIDLQEYTRLFYEALGPDESRRAFVHYPANTFPGQPAALADNTHFNPYGAYEIAKMVIMGMKRADITLTKHVRDDFTDFNPENPDDRDTFFWQPGGNVVITKPDGN